MRFDLFHASLLVFLAMLASAGHSAAQESTPLGRSGMQQLVGKLCAECHSAEEPEGDLDLVGLLDAPLTGDRALGELLALGDVLETAEMPPSDAPQPSAEERQQMMHWIDATLRSLQKSAPPPPAGRVTVRRLSRFEYVNTVRDLLAVELDPRRFPADDLGYGFDNIGDALTVTTMHLEKYATAVREAVAAAFPDADPPTPARAVAAGRSLRCSNDDWIRDEGAALISHGWAGAEFQPPRAGRYRVEISASGRQAGADLPEMRVEIGRVHSSRVDVSALPRDPETCSFEVTLDAEPLRVRAYFTNDYYDPDHPDRAQRDRNLYVHELALVGPLDRRGKTAAETRWLAKDPVKSRPLTRARRLLTPFLEVAWRRPVARSEVTPFAKLVDATVEAGEPFREGLRRSFEAALLSPYFLFRIERGGLAGGAKRAGEREGLTDHALATRLSYFLWSTLPDAALREAADDGSLQDAATLVEHTKRMLADPRADALASNFAAQWLELRLMDEVEPDPQRFPNWNRELATSMRRETELLFQHVLRQKLPVRTLLTADFTFLNERLARHYGVPRGKGAGPFTRVPVEDPARRGLLGHASILTVTSNPTRTSPVKRGKWVLTNLLDSAPPPPPPGSDSFAAGESAVATAAGLREQLAAHRRHAECAVCHERMDAIGLALENFDAIGGWRDSDSGVPIDASGTLPDGTRLEGPASLASVLADGPRFSRTALARLFVYAVGRPLTPADVLHLGQVHDDLPPDPSLHDLILAIVRLDAFRTRSIIGVR